MRRVDKIPDHLTLAFRETPVRDVPFELYDILADPREANNLYGKRPEIAEQLNVSLRTVNTTGDSPKLGCIAH